MVGVGSSFGVSQTKYIQFYFTLQYQISFCAISEVFNTFEKTLLEKIKFEKKVQKITIRSVFSPNNIKLRIKNNFILEFWCTSCWVLDRMGL